ncbi:hypothetical protein GCM10010512_42050 [Streptomyces thermoviolaceus subsp. thermoviolaceus]|nr:hypothetical protein GCM10010499_17340 [Streptomyces thermoviolaceus subsp. apingens]GHB06180.1 hypothetical protein GCM10010512_42050 [Streptomyces thermoviolaceus subsp. thermoviolaceus]
MRHIRRDVVPSHGSSPAPDTRPHPARRRAAPPRPTTAPAPPPGRTAFSGWFRAAPAHHRPAPFLRSPVRPLPFLRSPARIPPSHDRTSSARDRRRRDTG